MKIDYPMIDADNHYYEQDDCFTRHIDPQDRDLALRLEEVPGTGVRRWGLNGRYLGFIEHNPADRILPPGAIAGLFAGKADYSGNGVEPISAFNEPAFMHRTERLALMDRQNMEAALFIPSMAVLIEGDFAETPRVVTANYRAFNRWLEEEWGYGADGRIFGVPLLTLLDLDWAIEELERVASLGAKSFYVKTGPVGDLSPADPTFDPLWARVQEIGIHPVFHIGDNVFAKLYAAHWGEDPDRSHSRFSPLQHLLCNGERPISDTLAALVLHNLFGRFPGIKVLSVEHGTSWVPPLLKLMDKSAMMGRNGVWPFGRLDAEPSEVFREHVYLTPYPEDDVKRIVEIMGADHVLLGSDYPHPEGVTEPRDFLDLLEGLPESDVRLILRDNLAGLLGLATTR
ncbi:amidohydrolase family protein [Pseudonocardia thermophila]|uniref:amidohydrolase family protein n=1 Tax=Pseudonocardia thermophila TaxID=1848 RepID=UPI00248E09DB|nr:amidohydrolase family protein [Pseudonocardia thermophila]